MKITIHPSPKDIILSYGAGTESNKAIRAQIDKAGCWGYLEEDTIHIYSTPKCI